MRRLALAADSIMLGERRCCKCHAEGDTRTLSFHHVHTGEDITITFKRNGRYDDAALEQLSDWFMRDWRKEDLCAWTRICSMCCGSPIARSAPRSADRRRLRLPLARHQFNAAAALKRRCAEQQSHHRPRDGFLHPGVALGKGPYGRLCAAARRRRLLSDLRLPSASLHGHHPPLAAHDARPACQSLPRWPDGGYPIDGHPLPRAAYALALPTSRGGGGMPS